MPVSLSFMTVRVHTAMPYNLPAIQLEAAMTSLESKNQLIGMVLTNLAAACKLLSEHSAAPEHLQIRARQFLGDFNALSAAPQPNDLQQLEAEELLVQIARFLPNVLDIQVEAFKRTA
jgi:hypothetical protein